MIFFLKRLFRTGSRRNGLFLFLGYLLLLTLSSLLVMAAEPSESALDNFRQALWWSIVTSTTVGYGDVYPLTWAGKTVAVILPIFLGIGIGAAFITYLASLIIERKDRKMYGEQAYQGRNHIVIVGYTNETDYLVEQVLGDENRKERDVVVVATLDRHPLPDREAVLYVKGKVDTKDTLKKAGISKADRVVIHTGKDEESLFALINTLRLKKASCEVTVECISSDSLDTFSNIPGDFEIIMQMTAEMIVQAMQDKVHLPLQILLKNDEAEEIYAVTVPGAGKDWTWWALHIFLKERYNYLSFAMQPPGGDIHVNPDGETVVSKGARVWLIARQRPVAIDWS